MFFLSGISIQHLSLDVNDFFMIGE